MKNLILLLFILSLNTCFSQSIIEEGRQSIINTIFKNEVNLSNNYLDFKGIKFFIDQPKILDGLYGQPCIADDKLIKFADFFDHKDYKSIVQQIQQMRSNVLLPDSLNSNINLIEEDKITQGYSKISQPIVFNNKSIVYLKNRNEESILILQKDIKGDWQVICQKFLYLSIED